MLATARWPSLRGGGVVPLASNNGYYCRRLLASVTRSTCHRQRLATCSQKSGSMSERSKGVVSKPVLLFDIMDTVVRDPFYKHMPAHFSMTFKELLAAKHPSAWLEFEKGRISQDEFEASFFADGRSYDREGLRRRMMENYVLIEGMEEVLSELRAAGYDMHDMSNYPIWYKFVEERCQLSRFLPWTFVSCEGPMRGLRKPDPACFDCAMKHLGKDAQDLVLIDDRPPNVEAARDFGLRAILFESAEQLRAEMHKLDIHI